MKRALTYGLLQLKRTAKFAPFLFVITLLLCLSLGLALRVIVRADDAADKEKFTVGIVGDYSDSYLSLGVSALQTMDSSRFSIEIRNLTEGEAQKQLRDGSLMAYVVISEGFIEEAMHGRVSKLTYVTRASGLDLAVLFKDEVLEMISCMLVHSQNGIYGMQQILWEHQVQQDSFWEHTYAAMGRYMNLILNRSWALDQRITGISDGLSLGGYLFSGITVLLMLLCGLGGCPLFARRDRALWALLRSRGCGPLGQIAAEFIPYFLLMLLNTALLLGLLLSAGSVSSLIPELSGMTAGDGIRLFLGLVPGIFAITALQFTLYLLTDSPVSGILLQFLCAVGLAYVSGCFYPIRFFPESIQILSGFTPTGLTRGSLSALLSGSGSMAAALALWGYGLVLLWAAVLLRFLRLRRT